jgi:hypothetical protein
MPPLTDGSQVMWLGVAMVEVAGDRADSRRTDRNGRGVVRVGEGVAVGGIDGVVIGDVTGATLGSDESLLRVRPQRLGKGATTLGGGGGVGAGVGVATDVGTTLGSGGGVGSGDGVGSTVGGGGGDGVWGNVGNVGTWSGRWVCCVKMSDSVSKL